MDKRTLIFVLSLSLTLLGVNYYFDSGNQESLKEWHQQQKTKKQQEAKVLEEDIAKHTANIKDLPLVQLKDESGNVLNNGIAIGDSLITLSWDKDLPKTTKVNGQSFTLAYQPNQSNEPALYEKSKENKLSVGDLPYFGQFELQLVTLTKEKPQVNLAYYTDGRLSIPEATLHQIRRDLDDVVDEMPKMPGHALALMKTPEGYLPVGVYHPGSQSLTFLEQVEGLDTELKQPALADETQAAEQHYVLENAYQQFVFSTKGGALSEINLPFQSAADPESMIKEIAFDRELVEDHPYNARFPSSAYFTPGENPRGPYTETSKGKLGGYYPLLRRDLIQGGNKQSIRILPEYYALNIVSEYPEMAELNFKVTHFDQNSIVFEARQRNRKITKTYSLDREHNAPYVLNLSIHVEGDARGLWLTTGVPEVEWISNAAAPDLKYRVTRNGKVEVSALDKPKDSTTISSVNPDWICNSNGFLGIILDPLSEIEPGLRSIFVSGTTVPSRLVQVDEDHERFKSKDLPGYLMMLPLNPKGGTMNFRIYAGPFASATLKKVDQIYSDASTGYNPDYLGSQTFHGWFSFISTPFAKFLFILMNFFHAVTGSWGISIILLTVALRIMLYPLNAWSTKSMLKMQLISPEVQRIQEKHKKDPKKAQLEIMNLYREAGVNPISGCFPMLIQLPFLIGMFDLLKSTFELRGASFIPGWIDNLAAPDVLFKWKTPIFFIGNEFHLLPFLLGGVMFLQQKLMATGPKDPNLMTEQQRQQQVMGTVMTVVFTVMFYHFPSGLNIYWLSSMLLGILQQWWTQKRYKGNPLVIVPAPAKSKKGK